MFFRIYVNGYLSWDNIATYDKANEFVEVVMERISVGSPAGIQCNVELTDENLTVFRRETYET